MEIPSIFSRILRNFTLMTKKLFIVKDENYVRIFVAMTQRNRKEKKQSLAKCSRTDCKKKKEEQIKLSDFKISKYFDTYLDFLFQIC